MSTKTSDGQEISSMAAASRAGVSPATLRRWVRQGLIPQYAGAWTEADVGHARLVARLRERGHSLTEIRRAQDDGRLAFGYIEELFPRDGATYTLAQAARETGLQSALIERIIAALGWSSGQAQSLSEAELQLLRYVAAVLEAGLPLVAMLQLVRVYGQAMAQVADAEVRLFHLYVHEPPMRSGSGGLEMAEEMQSLTRFVEAVETTLPDDARVIKTIGDEVMIVGSDPAALTDWGLGLQALQSGRPLPRIAIHHGDALYRDGDYYGRDVNIASRVAARSRGGEVLVTRPVADAAGSHLECERIGEVRLEGFSAPTEIFIACRKDEQ